MSQSPQDPLTAEALKTRLESSVYSVLSVRRSVAQPAAELATHSRAVQDRFLAAVEYISQETVELAYNFAVFGLGAVTPLQGAAWDDWVQHILDTYDQGGVLAAISAMQKVDEYARQARDTHTGVSLAELRRVLEPFVQGLSGRPLKLAEADVAWTDTETVYLPPAMSVFAEKPLNYDLYKATVVYLWAQTWYGTWHAPLAEALAAYGRPRRALHIVHALETIRLDACIARELPGLYRRMRALREQSGGSTVLRGRWAAAEERLRVPGASIQDSLELLDGLYQWGDPPEPICYQGVLLPEETETVIAARKARERGKLQDALAAIAEAPGWRRGRGEARHGNADAFTVVTVKTGELPAGVRYELRFHGEPVPPVGDVQTILDSVVQDFGQVPDDYLVAAGPGGYRASGGGGRSSDDIPPTDGGVWRYDEWDYLRRQYRKDWCLLFERDVHPVQDDFAMRTLEKHRGVVRHLYRTFEALRGEEKILRKQPYGDGIDIDAVVEAYADTHVGLEASECLFSHRNRIERDIAVMFLVDMSGSTKGWVNDVEREALVLLCESLEILGDRYAIYGFSGFTHKRCELLRIKHLDEPYGDTVRARISGIKPQDYTRMGPFIRHLARLLLEVDVRTRLLVTVSDGRPDDQDGYRGEYGIEDTRQAIIEARHQGIHPFCITIDDEAMAYLPHMYGAAAFAVINDVHKLPFKVSDIYRRITM